MIAAILLAGGQSSRMGREIPDKVLTMVGKRSVFAWSFDAFASSGVPDIVVIVHRDEKQREDLDRETSSHSSLPTIIWTKGGIKRNDSVRNGLRAMPEEIDTVFIHDCARPLIRPETLVSLKGAVARHDAVTLAHRITDTTKLVCETEKDDIYLTKSLDRQCLWAMETPQVFQKNLIVRAHAHAEREDIALTDDVSAVEALGEPIHLMEAGYPNPKITTQDDLDWINHHLAERKTAS